MADFDLDVLILIVVEDGLVPDGAIKMGLSVFTVLILIVVEDGLVQNICHRIYHQLSVLILIVVEDGLVPANKSINLK